MTLVNILLLTFIFYLPTYFIFLIFLSKKAEGYSIINCIISDLGQTSFNWSNIFNITTILYGILSLIIPYKLIISGINHSLLYLGIFGLFITSIATILVGLFPIDTKRKMHNIISYFVFGSVIFNGIVFVFIPHKVSIIPNYISYLSASVLAITGILITTKIKIKIDSKYAPYEWMCLLGTILWNLALASFLLTY